MLLLNKQKKFLIKNNKEYRDIKYLVQIVKESGFCYDKTIIVNCSPEYSSFVSMVLAQQLSPTPLSIVNLEMPYPNNDLYTVEDFHRDLKKFAVNNSDSEHNFLFIDSGVIRGKNFKDLSQIMTMYNLKFKTGALYVKQGRVFTPDFYVQEFKGDLMFEWERDDNPNWDY